jgi:hypothetical protein
LIARIELIGRVLVVLARSARGAELGGRRLQRFLAPPDERDPGVVGVGVAGKLCAQVARSA